MSGIEHFNEEVRACNCQSLRHALCDPGLDPRYVYPDEIRNRLASRLEEAVDAHGFDVFAPSKAAPGVSKSPPTNTRNAVSPSARVTSARTARTLRASFSARFNSRRAKFD